jgi:hypothetical protein
MTDVVQQLVERTYQFGFHSDIDTELAPRGLNEDVVRLIWAKKDEPEWLLEWRLAAYRHWTTMEPPAWQNVNHPPIDFQDMHYWAAPKPKGPAPASLDEVDPEIRATFDKLGISLAEQERLSGVAVDAIIDSVSVATTFKATLAEAGVIFCSFSEAVREHPELVRRYLGSVVPPRDSFHAALNSAVFSDGSFCYVPAGVRCPMELSTYFRMNAAETGQFERTLIVAEEGATVSYLEGCTAPMRDENQLHAAVEVPQRHPPGRRLDRRVLLRGGHDRAPAGGHRHEDDPHRQEQPQHHRVQGHLGRQGPADLPGPGEGAALRHRCTEPHPVRLAAHRLRVRRPHVPLHRGQERLGPGRARSLDLEDQRRPALLLPPAGPRRGGRHVHDR